MGADPFTPERIARLRKAWSGEDPVASAFCAALDEIERLRALVVAHETEATDQAQRRRVEIGSYDRIVAEKRDSNQRLERLLRECGTHIESSNDADGCHTAIGDELADKIRADKIRAALRADKILAAKIRAELEGGADATLS